jgi:subtilisin family serine protease
MLAAAASAASAQIIPNLPGGIGNPLRGGIGDSVVGPVTRKAEEQVDKTVQGVTGLADRTISNLPGPLGAPRGVMVEDNWRAVDHEWVVLIRPEQLPALNRGQVRIVSRTPLPSAGLVLVRVIVSDQDNTPGRAQALLRSLGATAADRNHIYDPQAGPEPSPEPSPAPAPPAAKGGKVRIGLIDTAINRKHAALKRAKINVRDFVGGKTARPTAHGTGIASILVGAEKGHEGLLPGAELLAASVFYQADKNATSATGATTASLVAALDWMATERVPVVNMSLAGPPNEVLGDMIARVYADGVLVVAAVGNDGPASRPLYPAAFEPVVAVTAVDRTSQIYRWANQGPQVDVAAWGVGSVVARDKGGYEEESGTSFAAPIVSAAIAQLVANGASSTSAALKKLIASAEDLGPSGRDDTYGYGLVRPVRQ